MLTIFRKEFNSFLNSLIAYLVICVFLTGIGLFMWVFPQTSVLHYGYANLDPLFYLGPFVLMFLIPAITMRSFAEEKKTGTIELILTKPVRDTEIVAGKYLAGLALVFFSILPTAVYYYSVYQLGSPPGNVDSAGAAGSYIGLLLLGACFTSIGILASSLTENQIISFVIGVFLCFLFYNGFEYLSGLSIPWIDNYVIRQLGIAHHYNSISKGVIDSRDVLYFLSVIVIMLKATHLVLGMRKW